MDKKEVPPVNPANVGEKKEDPNAMHQILPPKSISAGNYDRAWNDPPLFSLDSGISAISSNKPVPTKLNKRVAYPNISGSGSTGNPSVSPNPVSKLDGSLPPRSQNQQGPLSAVNVNTQVDELDFVPSFETPEVISPENPHKIHPDVTAQCTKEKLFSLLKELLHEEPLLDGPIEIEVTKRLALLVSKWDTLPIQVQKKLLELGSALEAKDFRSGDSIQLQLCAEFMSNCSSWITAIKQIIRKHLQS